MRVLHPPDRIVASLNMEGIIATRRQTLGVMDAVRINEGVGHGEVEIRNALAADEFVHRARCSCRMASPQRKGESRRSKHRLRGPAHANRAQEKAGPPARVRRASCAPFEAQGRRDDRETAKMLGFARRGRRATRRRRGKAQRCMAMLPTGLAHAIEDDGVR